MIKVVKAMYRSPQFYVSMSGAESQTKTQKTGIRQCCPLYLFTILMTALFRDIHDTDRAKTKQQRVTGTDHDQVVYADDTICIAQTTAAMNRLLDLIKTDGNKYGLKLNKHV